MTYEQFYFWVKGLIDSRNHPEHVLEKIIIEINKQNADLYKNKIPVYGNCS